MIRFAWSVARAFIGYSRTALTPGFPAGALAAAVVEDRDQERLGLAGPGAGRDQRRLGLAVLAVQPLPRLDLVQVRDRLLRRPLQDLPPVRARVP